MELIIQQIARFWYCGKKLYKGKRSGGPLHSLSQPFFLTIEVAEIISYRQAKPYENVSFLTDLYLKRQWCLSRISDELGCTKATVRKNLIAAGINLQGHHTKDYKLLRTKIIELRERGMSYQAVADLLNLWRIDTRTKNGSWHAKTVRDLTV